MTRLARPSWQGAGSIGGVAKTSGTAPPPRLAKLNAPLGVALTFGTKVGL
jgi:hypothetical protein